MRAVIPAPFGQVSASLGWWSRAAMAAAALLISSSPARPQTPVEPVPSPAQLQWQRLEFTAIGNTINVAARIEQLTKTVGVQLLLTEATYLQLAQQDGVRELPPQSVRGIEGQLRVFTADATTGA